MTSPHESSSHSSGAYESSGRTNQKFITRAAIKAAAAALLQTGATPNMDEIARAARVSKSTAYRYFPSQEVLLAEVMLDTSLGIGLQNVYTTANTTGTAAERLDAVVRADHALVVQHESAFRKAIGTILITHTDDEPRSPRRPGNRLNYLADALTPLADQLGDKRVQRLVSSLALCVGLESIIVMRDICGLDSAEAEAIKRWAAGALLNAALQESLGAQGPPAA